MCGLQCRNLLKFDGCVVFVELRSVRLRNIQPQFRFNVVHQL